MSSARSKDQRRLRGSLSEEKAVLYLQSRGYSVIARNWRNRYGELDIVAMKDDAVNIVEVRSGCCGVDSDGEERDSLVLEFFSSKKVKKLRNLGRAWCLLNGYDPDSLAILLLAVTWYNSRRFKVEEVPVW